MKVTDYIVLQEGDNIDLAYKVKSCLADGWILQGGVSVSVSESDEFSYAYFVQAMIKEEAE